MVRESKPKRFNWRLILGLAVLLLVTSTAAMAAYKVRRFVTTDPQFSLSREHKDAFQIEGLRYTSRAKVVRVFAADFGRSIFSIPLDDRRRALREIDWVEDASVSRIWPDRLVLRIRERKPVAFVLLRQGVRLIDSQGVLLEQPPQSQFSFPVLSGVRPDDSIEGRRERVGVFLSLQREMGYLMRDLSEVDAGDPGNVRVVAQVDNRAVDLLLGDSDFGKRYQNFLNHYPEIHRRSPEVKRFDLRLDDRITAKE